MIKHTRGRLVSQVHRARSQLSQSRDLCMETLLPQEQLEQAIARHVVHFRNRL